MTRILKLTDRTFEARSVTENSHAFTGGEALRENEKGHSGA